MCTIRVFACKPDTDTVRVLWRIGNKPVKAIAVTLRKPVSDGRTAAELAALHHLLLEQEVAGENRGSANLHIHCSRPATKKLLRGKSSKTDLIAYARGLRSRFPDLSVRVLPRHDLADAASEQTLTLDGPLEYTQDTAIAPVAIRRHAIERFMQRAHCASIEQARKAVVNMLTSNRLRKAELTPARRRGGIIRHKKPAELWVCDNWCFCVVNEQANTRSLVTIYQKGIH